MIYLIVDSILSFNPIAIGHNCFHGPWLRCIPGVQRNAANAAILSETIANLAFTDVSMKPADDNAVRKHAVGLSDAVRTDILEDTLLWRQFLDLTNTVVTIALQSL